MLPPVSSPIISRYSSFDLQMGMLTPKCARLLYCLFTIRSYVYSGGILSISYPNLRLEIYSGSTIPFLLPQFSFNSDVLPSRRVADYETCVDICAVASQNGNITIFDTALIHDDMNADEAVIDVLRSSRPSMFPVHTGAVRSMSFSPSPWDLFSWWAIFS